MCTSSFLPSFLASSSLEWPPRGADGRQRVLEAHVQAAVVGNQMVRLDSPMLRAKLGSVGKAHATAASIVLQRGLCMSLIKGIRPHREYVPLLFYLRSWRAIQV